MFATYKQLSSIYLHTVSVISYYRHCVHTLFVFLVYVNWLAMPLAFLAVQHISYCMFWYSEEHHNNSCYMQYVNCILYIVQANTVIISCIASM